MNEYDEHIPGRRSIFRTTAMIEDVERDIARPMQVAGIAINLLAPVKKTLSNNLESWGKILSKEEVQMNAQTPVPGGRSVVVRSGGSGQGE